MSSLTWHTWAWVFVCLQKLMGQALRHLGGREERTEGWRFFFSIEISRKDVHALPVLDYNALLKPFTSDWQLKPLVGLKSNQNPVWDLNPQGQDLNFVKTVLGIWTHIAETHLQCRRPSSIPALGRSPEEGNRNRLQYCCLENLMDRGSW